MNNLYGKTFRHGGLYLKTEAKKLKEEIGEIIRASKINAEEFKEKKLRVKVQVFENWITKKGDVKKKDVANREKFIIDKIFEILGLEDKFVYDMRLEKIQSDSEHSIVSIEEYKL